MNETFQSLIETKDLWLPALTWLLGQLSATKTGISIEHGVKKRLKWLKAPEAEKAFQEAFTAGIQKYQKNRSGHEVAQAVASVLVHVANHDTSNMDRAAILEQIFADRIEPETLSSVLSRNILAIEGRAVSTDVVSKELYWLINRYLRPAFRSQPYFTDVVGFAEVIGLLKDIKENLAPTIDLHQLQKGYYRKIVSKYEFITMQGISPKVQNRTIGIRMQDVFIALEARRINNKVPTKEFELWKQLLKIAGSEMSGVIEPPVAKKYFDRMGTELSVSFTLSEVEELEQGLIVDDLSHENLAVKAADYAMRSRVFQEGRIRQVLGSYQKSQQLKGLIQLPHIVVQGHPGSGKSTIVKYICWAISSHTSDLVGEEILNHIPISIRAIEFGESLQKGQVDSLDEFIIEQAGRFAPLFKFALSAGKAFIFIDGLDEVGLATLRSRVKERVDDFVADPAFSDNRILITTRIVGYQPDGITGQFPHFELKELDDEQISKFVQNWYQAIHDEMPASVNVETEQRQLLDAVLNNPSIHRMAQNPLLLTILALIKWQGRSLPEQRVLLYDAAAQTLIRSWPLAQRAVEFDELFIREWLAPIAEKIFNNPTSDLIDEYSLTDELVDSMMSLKSLPKLEAKSETQKLLDDISLHSGILLPRGTDEDGRNLFGFLHQTFAEYLTAYYFAGKWEDRKLDIKKYAHDPYWREVLLLMAGHLGTQRRAKAGQLLRAILDMNSSQYEPIIHRDLILAGHMLGDAVPAPAEIVKEILMGLVELWKTTKYSSLREDIEEVFSSLETTEYGPVLARISKEDGLDEHQTLELAQLIGGTYFSEELASMINSHGAELKIQAARLLVRGNDIRGLEGLLHILENADDLTSMRIFNEFSRLKNYEGMIKVLETMVEKQNYSFVTNKQLLRLGLGVRRRTQQNAATILENEIMQVSQSAKWMLALMFPPDPKSEPYLLDCLTSGNDQLILMAAGRLAGEEIPQGIEALIDLMNKSNDAGIRMSAAFALANLKNEAAILYLKSIIDDANSVDRLRAARVLLAKYGDPYGRQALIDALHSSDESYEPVIIHDLLRKMPEFSMTKDYIELLLNNPNQLTQVKLAAKLASDGIQEGTEHLKNLLLVNNLEVCLEAAKALLDVSEQNDQNRDIAKAVLMRLSSSDDMTIALSAAQALVSIDQEEGFEKLKTLSQSYDVSVRYGASHFLSIQSKSEKAFDILKSNLPKMLVDFEPTDIRSVISTSTKPQYVADIAFRFIHANITPTGELVFSERDDGPL